MATSAASSSLCTSTLTTCSSAARPAVGPKPASRSASGSDPWPGSRRWWRASEASPPVGRRRPHRVAELQPPEAPRCEDHLELAAAGPHTHVVQHVDHDDAAGGAADRHGFGRRRRIGPRHVLEPDDEAEGLGHLDDVGDGLDRRSPVDSVRHHQHRRRPGRRRLLEQRRRIDVRSDPDDLGVVQREPDAGGVPTEIGGIGQVVVIGQSQTEAVEPRRRGGLGELVRVGIERRPGGDDQRHGGSVTVAPTRPRSGIATIGDAQCGGSD